MSTIKLDIPVVEFTTPNPLTTTEDTNLDQLTDLMSSCGIRHIPIVQDGKVTGIISDRDLRLIEGLGLQERVQVRAADIMVADPVSVKASASLDEVAFEMSDRKIGSVIVNDDNGDFLGIFTVTDALNALIEIVRANRRAA